MIDRPRPPAALCEPAIIPEFGAFVPAPEVGAWIRGAFLDDGAPFFNPDHQHLRWARIGVLWTNVENVKQQRRVVGQCEMPANRGSKWAKARADIQLVEWFGFLPDFLITLSAPYGAATDDASFYALVDHECYHAAQALDMFDAPKFHTETGLPVYAMRDHDVSEFVGVARRWGATAAGPHAEAFVAAAVSAPEFSPAAIASLCGTCLVRA